MDRGPTESGFNLPDDATIPAFKSETQHFYGEAGEPESRAFVSNEVLAGRFRILRFISSGGMGEVYAAEDLQLGGEVAVKTIRSDFALNPSIIERFRREISLGLRITHPNVCRLFDLEIHRSESREIAFLTMELLEGETLESWMKRHGAVSAKIAAPIMLQVLNGLQAAHEAGVVHGDFKPSNVFLVSESNGATRAVVMDFGLAFLTDAKREGTPDFVGTPLYMAPEQLEGRATSMASDIYSVGVVLYELTTGRKPWAANSSSALLKQMRQKPLSPKRYAPHLEEYWERAILQCLSPEPQERPASTQALVQALRLQPPLRVPVSWKRRAAELIPILCILAGAILWLRNGSSERIESLTQVTSETDLSADPSLSRNGQMLAYESDRGEPGNLDIWVQKLPNGTPRRITTDPAEDDDTNLSADGSLVVFHSDRNGGGIYIADTAGGPERLLAPFGHRPRVSPDGRTVAFWTGEYDESIPSGQIYKVAAAGGSPERLASDFADARYPIWSPDGRWILFTGCRQLTKDAPLGACQEWWVTAANSSALFNTGALSLIHRAGIRTRYWPNDWFAGGVFFAAYAGRQSDIWRVALSPGSWRVTGKPLRLTSGARSAVDASVAVNRTIAFGQLGAAVHVWQLPLAVRKDNRGPFKLTNGPDSDVNPSISRDGRLLAFSRGEKQRRAIWSKDLTSGQESELAHTGVNNVHPVVSSSGKQIAYESDNATSKGIFVVSPGRNPALVCFGCEYPTGWVDNDQTILFTSGATGQIRKVALSDHKISTVLSGAGLRLGDAAVSPAGDYLLFTVATSAGRRQIFATKLPKGSAASIGEWIPITSSTEWDDNPQWSSDGSVIYFLSNRDNFTCLWAQRFDAKTGRTVSAPFAVAHFHDPHANPGLLVRSDFGLSVSNENVVFNSGEVNETIWRGILKRPLFPGF